ncbi:hypothetical protein NX059_009338 [Plenodomus lindquistii]|nr:hypothetical protein NX059_009338 [Plenodomus lindquistii]
MAAPYTDPDTKIVWNSRFKGTELCKGAHSAARPDIVVRGVCPQGVLKSNDFPQTPPEPTILTTTITASRAAETASSSLAVIPSPSTSIVARSSSSATATGLHSKPGIASKGLGNGAVAGVAVAMLVAGVILAGVVFFVLLRRQKRKLSKTYTHQHLRPGGENGSQEKGPIVQASAIASSVDDLIPQPVADDTITGEVSRIRDSIKNHARTYYHSAAMPASSLNASYLHGLATATGVSANTLAASLANPTTRQDSIRLVLGWCILSKCTGERRPSLLSADLSRFATSIQDADGNDSTTSRMYSKWKTITSALLQHRFGRNAPNPSRAENFATIVAEIDAVLAPFVQGSVDGGQRHKNLDMILKRAANFAFLLFSQPGSFHFDFASEHNSLVAFPAFVQIIGDQGRALRPARVLLDKEVAI